MQIQRNVNLHGLNKLYFTDKAVEVKKQQLTHFLALKPATKSPKAQILARCNRIIPRLLAVPLERTSGAVRSGLKRAAKARAASGKKLLTAKLRRLTQARRRLHSRPQSLRSFWPVARALDPVGTLSKVIKVYHSCIK